MPLHPEVAAFLDQLATIDHPPLMELSPEQFRAYFKGMAVVGSRPEHPAATEDGTVPGGAGDIPVRIYRPKDPGLMPIVVFFHGGGWTIGDLDTADSYLLTEEIMGWFISNYLGGAEPKDPDVSPLLAEGLAGLPPALVVTAEFDPLRDEGEAYAARLREDGVDAKAVRYQGMVHYFLSMDLVVSDAKDALADTLATLRARLAPGGWVDAAR